MASIALIGLGSNMGDRRGWLEGAIETLAATPGVRVRRVSSFLETEPVGGPSGQGAYLNAAAVLETTLGPLELLRMLQAIEDRSGRVRAVRWGERTLDLDLLLFDDRIIEEEALSVPHPRLAERRFVLEPLAEVAPEAIEPRTGRSVSELLADLDRPADAGIPRAVDADRRRPCPERMGPLSFLPGCPSERPHPPELP